MPLPRTSSTLGSSHADPRKVGRLDAYSETSREGEGTRHMTNLVIQSQASWGAVERIEKGKRMIRLAPTTIDNDELKAWLIEAAARYVGKALSVPTLQSLPVLFPFMLTRPLTYVISNSPNLDLRSEGLRHQFVVLRRQNKMDAAD